VTISTRPLPTIPDIADNYAARVRELLAARNETLTATEITAALGCHERRVREALDRLVFTSEVEAELRHTPGKRGALPRAYRLKRSPSLTNAGV
jgi:predicted ArsR family transcriptional regulator